MSTRWLCAARNLFTARYTHRRRGSPGAPVPLTRIRHTDSRQTDLHGIERLEDRLALSGFGPADGAYIIDPRVGVFNDVRIQPADQAIMTTGRMVLGSALKEVVARYDSQGTVDAAYGNGGVATTGLSDSIGLTLQPDGKAVVAGRVLSNGFILGLARLNTDGSPDAHFGSAGVTTLDVQPGQEIAHSVALQSTGKIVVAGVSNSTTNSSTNDPSNLVARFTAAGALDKGAGGFGQLSGSGKNATPIGYALTSLGARYEQYNDLIVQPDNKVVTVGRFDLTNGSSRLVVARYTADGALDKTFNKTGLSWIGPTGINTLEAQAVALQADGKIVVAGSSSGVDGAQDMFVARFTSTGVLDTTFGGGSGYARLDVDGTTSQTTEYARDVVIQPDGKIVVVGREYAAVAEPIGSVLVARFNPNGTPDTTFGGAGYKLGTPAVGSGYDFFWGGTVALQSDSSIIVAGWADAVNDAGRYPLLMRFAGSASSSLQAASAGTSVTAILFNSTTASPQQSESDSARVKKSSPTESSVAASPDLAVFATTAPRRESPTDATAVDRVFTEDDLYSGMLEAIQLGALAADGGRQIQA